MVGTSRRPDVSTIALPPGITREKIFGPVLAVMTFHGLSASVWGAKIFAMTKRLRAGVVWANTFCKLDPTSPSGGYKESGFGREGGAHELGAYVVEIRRQLRTVGIYG